MKKFSVVKSYFKVETTWNWKNWYLWVLKCALKIIKTEKDFGHTEQLELESYESS